LDYIKTNQQSWDKRTKIHVRSEFYDVEGFLAGSSSLREIELSELDDVNGKKLLHLQCHFGLDTLSWAREGAIVTGVDLSPVAIEKANELKRTSKLNGKFICSDIYDFGNKSAAKYDIVFTSYGSICWLPDLKQWAKVIASSLKPNGIFYMADFHPIQTLESGYRYFHSSKPNIEEEGTYTENCDGKKSTLVSWSHPISEILNSLIEAGVKIDCFNEYPFSPYNCFEGLEERQKGRFYLTKLGNDMPLVYTIKATKTNNCE